MGTAGLIFLASVVLFGVGAFMARSEEKRARRLVGARVRASLDTGIIRFEERFARRWRHMMRYIVQLGWYYSIHSLLAGLMRVLVSIYDSIEQVFEQNRTRTRELRKEFKHHRQQSHLTEIAEHRESTALSHEEQVALRHKKLTEDH